MANRTATYFAFDGLGQTDPTKSDFRYYATIKGWNASGAIDFKFVNSHDKASAVRDTSKLETLKASIRKRLAASKNMVAIITRDTRKTGSMLSWEIEKATDYFEIPLIIAYPNYASILNPSSHRDKWPKALAERIDNASAKAIHIPFKKDALLSSIRRFSVNGEKLGGPLTHYTKDAQVEWGYI